VTVGSLFSGIGLGDLCMMLAGHEIAWQVEHGSAVTWPSGCAPPWGLTLRLLKISAPPSPLDVSWAYSGV